MSRLAGARGRRDLRLNVRPLEMILRLSLGLALPFMLVWVHPLWLIIVNTVVATYLLVTAALFFCPLKFFFQHVLAGNKGATKDERKMPFKDL
ncbi:YgaP-like transmembrane domain [Taibaiella helva]|uniref:YgaP-like transmembrane domain n=1 Tax=Taibaiella helva TaxID=2301235 RepID=UPI000E570695|nr:YgaP-like transmembrane domain [Taibaiella helva]